MSNTQEAAFMCCDKHNGKGNLEKCWSEHFEPLEIAEPVKHL